MMSKYPHTELITIVIALFIKSMNKIARKKDKIVSQKMTLMHAGVVLHNFVRGLQGDLLLY